MNNVLAKQISQNIEVYIDDMVAKIPRSQDYYLDLSEIFSQL